MVNFVAAQYQSQAQPHSYESIPLRRCSLAELPERVSIMKAGSNIQISHPEAVTEAGEVGESFGLLVFWTPTAEADKVWNCVRSQFLGSSGLLDHSAVAISARKHKRDWYIEEFKRPFGECRFTVYIPHTDRSAQVQAAQRLADLLAALSTSHIFYVSKAQVDQEKSTPQAVRLTDPVYQSATHHLVYVQPQTGLTAANGHVSNRGNGNMQRTPDAERWDNRDGGSTSREHAPNGECSNAEVNRDSPANGSSDSRQRSPGGEGQPQKYCPPHRRQQ